MKNMKQTTGRVANQPHSVIAVVLCMVLLGACAGISKSELQSLGAQVTAENVDFAGLESFARRSRIAYESEEAIRTAYPKTVRIASPGQTEVRYVLERDDKTRTQFITVRGTANHKNLSEDMAFKVREDRKAKIPVHSGFDAAALAVYADLQGHLKPGYSTRITGHSLGGAVAALVGIYAIEDGHKIERVVTFGQPRFTTATGVSQLGFLPITRVVDENDMVPMLPPAAAIDKVHGPYEHVGPEIILLEGPHYVYLLSHDANRIAIGEFWRSIGIANLDDHKMDNYLKRLAAKKQGAVQVPYNERERYVAKPSKAATVN
jgi:hypothetical protein